MEPATVASVIVAIIAAAAAYASQRAAAKATVINTKTTNQSEDIRAQADALKEGYERARKFDVETIQRQDAEITELRTEVSRLVAQNRALNLRVWYLERGYKPIEIAEDSDVIDVEGEETNGT